MKQKQRGVSVVIVVFLIMIMVTFAAGSAMLATQTYRQIGRVISSNQAYYAAEGSLEEALLSIKKYGTGFSQSEPTQTDIKGKSLMSSYEKDCLAKGGDTAGSDSGANSGAKPNGEPNDGNDATGKPKSSAGDLGGVDCDKILANKDANDDSIKMTDVKADWKLTTSSVKQDSTFQVQLSGDGANKKVYYSVPIAGTGNAGGTLCGPGEIIPLVNGHVTEGKNGMGDFIDKYNAELKAKGATTSGGNTPTLSSNLAAADHPCHWNKLYVSDVGGGDKPGTVTIPLYTQELINENGKNGLLIRNPANSYFIDANNPDAGPKLLPDTDPYGGGLKFGPDSELYIRFRTPCKPLQVTDGKNVKTVEREMCNPNERYKLNTADHNDVVVSWKIYEAERNPCGTVLADGVCSPDVDDAEKVQHVVGPIVPGGEDIKSGINIQNSTEIRESFINAFMTGGDSDFLYGILDSFRNVILQNKQPSYGLAKILANFTKYAKGLAQDDLDKWRIYKPLLEMVNVSTLDVDTAKEGGAVKNLPYLEYQLLSSVSYDPFSDVFQTITAQAIVNGLKQTIKVKISQGGNLLQYVIQQ